MLKTGSTPQNSEAMGSRMKVVALCTMSEGCRTLRSTKKEGGRTQKLTTPLGSQSAATVEKWLPNHQKRERSLSPAYKLFLFALDLFRINS